ncbi:MAG TPA: DUF1697 domain-containing protein [Ilumatobacteraceae bacterium]|jgi:uncharacterized protein (DUF1697 family)|nr:DUF1697 domain-containing protein [Ilumatobacteraceae bacterium]
MRMHYVAFLRGINVGGKNLISMADLRKELETAGYGAVRTYIQSGNALFETDAPRAELEESIEALLAERLGCPVLVVVRSHRQLANVVASAPAGFGADRDTHLSDVVFLKAPLTSAQAMRAVSLREGVDRAWAGTGVLYLDRVAERSSQSRFSRLASTPHYRKMTIRNWSTTTRLLAMLDER